MAIRVPGYVYFVRPVGAEGPVKIGFSVTPVQRLLALATWSPVPLELAVAIPGDLELESKLHRIFWDLQTHREWFKTDPAITALINKLIAGVPVGDAVDLEAVHKVASKKAAAFAREPDRRLACSYSHRLGWAERKASRDSEYYWHVPKDVTEIMRRWTGWGQAARTKPSDAEIARLEEVLANPAAHLIRYNLDDAA